METSGLLISTVIAIILGVAYIAVASIGINVYNKCDDIQEMKKWKNVHMMLSNTLVVAMVIPIVLISMLLTGSKVGAAIALLYGLMGIVGSASAYSIAVNKNCKDISEKSEQNYLMIAAGIFFMIFLVGGALSASGSSSSL